MHEAEIELNLQGLTTVVETLSYGKHSKGHGYKIMRIMDGGSLTGWLRRNPAQFKSIEIPKRERFKQIFSSFARSFELADLKLRLALITPVFKKLIQAVEAIHAKDVIHGDLKPGNIYLNEDLSALKLFDFGLARKTNSTLPFKIPFKAYTPNYVSPEVLSGKMPEAADDWCSVMCIFWEMLFGREALRNCEIPVSLNRFPELKFFFKKAFSDKPSDRAYALSLLKKLF